MTETTPQSSGEFDLSQFHAIFHEEAAENLQTMERLLLSIELESSDDEELNAIFRCAHSVKGGAATFGFSEVAELTHEMETLLDRLRRRELKPTPRMVDVLLESGDALRALLDALKTGKGTGSVHTEFLVEEIRALASGRTLGRAAASPSAMAPVSSEAQPDTAAAQPSGAQVDPKGRRLLELVVGPLENPAQADNLKDLFRDIADLGEIESLDGGIAADGMRRFKVLSLSTDEELIDLFSFHIERDRVTLKPLDPAHAFQAPASGEPATPVQGARTSPEGQAPAKSMSNIEGFGLFDDLPAAPPPAVPAAAAPASASAVVVAPQEQARGGEVQEKVSAADAIEPQAPGRSKLRQAAGGADGTLRVAVEKVDQLINLVGELVITQAVLTQTATELDASRSQQLAVGLADLERNTRNLQEAVMSIRMIPMSVVFNRFPRMLRELAAKLDKQVEFVTQGEATELDKGMVEKITDPLTHLVRNSCDHGIEMPQERLARGKPAFGTITLAASHQGGNIAIEVRDDGRGLSRAKLLAKAREKGMDAPDSLTDAEVWNLIFAPGFSTAEAVTDVSGRGVGMDVVKKNISSLGGTVDIESAEGKGMVVRVRLPLTLAIMEGMLVQVAGECYILPLASIVESFQPAPHRMKTALGGEPLVRVREEYLPVVSLERLFNVPRAPGESAGEPLMVVLESDGRRVVAVVDELLGQQQVVVKNLESNYRRVDNVSGATILGDGSVALILDVAAIVVRASGQGRLTAALQ